MINKCKQCGFEVASSGNNKFYIGGNEYDERGIDKISRYNQGD